MLGFLNNLRIQNRLILLVALPIIAVLVYSVSSAVTAYKAMQKASMLMEVAEFAPHAVDLIHDLQKEDAKTAALLIANDPAKKRDIQNQLEKQYKLAEKHREQFLYSFEHVHFENFSAEFEELAAKALKGLDEVAELRVRVKKGNISGSKATKIYHKHIRELLDLIEYIASHSPDAKLTDQFTAYAALLEAQEALATQRRLGAVGISSRNITIKDREALSESLGKEHAFEHVFHTYATDHEKELYQKLVENSENNRVVKEWIHQYLDPNLLNQLLTHSALDWFGIWTDKIDSITKVEEGIAHDIQEYVGGLYNEARSDLTMAIVVNAVQLTITIILVITIAGSITGPVNALNERMQKLADDDLDFEIPDVGQGHELADMASTLEVFRENAEQMKQMEAKQEKLKAQAEIDKKVAQMKMADDFDERTASVIAALTGSAESMKTVAGELKAVSEQTTSVATNVSAAAEEASANVQTVAAATEELTASSKEISQQISSTAQRASEASDTAEKTSAEVSELNELADSIGEVVGAIKDIAEQTNLLALNATIEAARAGAAGKGFAVVADEVKKLATETAQKTEEIDGRVTRIQEAIRNSVDAVNAIITNVKNIDEATTAVSAAVEEQNAATSEIGRNVTEASTGTAQVSQGVTEVNQAASETSNNADAVLRSANDLADQAEVLKEQVDMFLAEIRGDAEGAAKKPAKEPKAEEAPIEAPIEAPAEAEAPVVEEAEAEEAPAEAAPEEQQPEEQQPEEQQPEEQQPEEQQKAAE